MGSDTVLQVEGVTARSPPEGTGVCCLFRAHWQRVLWVSLFASLPLFVCWRQHTDIIPRLVGQHLCFAFWSKGEFMNVASVGRPSTGHTGVQGNAVLVHYVLASTGLSSLIA